MRSESVVLFPWYKAEGEGAHEKKVKGRLRKRSSSDSAFTPHTYTCSSVSFRGGERKRTVRREDKECAKVKKHGTLITPDHVIQKKTRQQHTTI
ncbi:hypothetical protein LY76DRAFT_593605 [Colletotrichum caudatum]|nr:hypothetical protein LY76DRAFT_593605 [Colletotrichum caudatum]